MKRTALQLMVISALLLSACAKQTPAPVKYTVEMTEFAFKPNLLEAQVGQDVTIEVVNRGTLTHELMIGQHMMKMGEKPNGYEVDFFEKSGVTPEIKGIEMMQDHSMGHSGSLMVTLPKTNDQATITFKVTKAMVGEWEIGCFAQEDVHYMAGMTGKLVVNP